MTVQVSSHAGHRQPERQRGGNAGESNDRTEGERASPTAAPHPEEMNASVHLRIGSTVSLQASARATPAGLIAVGVLAAAVLLTTTALVRAARGRAGGPVRDAVRHG